MRNYTVIENDIVLEEILAVSREIGFDDMTMAVFTDRPITMPPGKFLSMIRHGDRQVYEDLGTSLFEQAKSKSVFALRKPGTELLDSRTASALDAKLKVVGHRFTSESRRLTISLLASNVGAGVWLPSGPDIGAVNVGVKILTAAGAPITGEPIRFRLSEKPVATAEVVQIELLIDLAELKGDLLVEIDLVSERVIWFSQIGLALPRIPLSTG
jgi:hypothetical protein